MAPVLRHIVHPSDFSDVPPIPISQVRAAFSGLRETDPTHGRVLTDNFNPVEFYDAHNRERHRRYMATGMKES